MAQVTVYIPDKLWDDYKALLAALAPVLGEEEPSTSRLVRSALEGRIAELKAGYAEELTNSDNS